MEFGSPSRSTYAQKQWGGKVARFHALGSDVGALNNALLAVHGLQEREGESGASVGH